MSPFHVIVVGAVSTGAATAHDLALRGLRVTVIERGEVASGTTGRNHCLLHSGGRYCVTDQVSARECIEENTILRSIMPDLLELNDGPFVALTEADLAFKEPFLEGCAASRIPARDIPVKHALEMEPFLNPKTLAAVQVPDKDYRTGKTETLGADLVINAAGPWAAEIAAQAGISVPEVPTAGVMVTLDSRLNNMVLNRLNKPSDGDIVVPQRATSTIGTTSWIVQDPDVISIPPEHVERMITQGEQLLPIVRKIPMRAKMAVARPLIARSGGDAREVSRTFECFDHAIDGVEGFVTIAGGKTTTARAMAERVTDMACKKLGIAAACPTREVPLASYRLFYERGAL